MGSAFAPDLPEFYLGDPHPTFRRLRRDYRSFRPDRMEGVELLEETFDEGVSLADFLARTGTEGAERT